jgi:tuftelin-interacting protein 11
VAFVSKASEDTATPSHKSKQDESIDEAESSPSSSGENEDEDEDEAVEPRIPDQEEEPPQPRGLGAMKAASSMFQHFGAPHVQSSAAPSASRSSANAADVLPRAGGIGSSPRDATKGASSSRASTPASVVSFSLDDASLPKAFGSPAATSSTPRSRQQRSFVRNEAAATAPNLTTEEKRHFEGLINSSFGAKMMAKMGWQAVRTTAPSTLSRSHINRKGTRSWYREQRHSDTD